MLYSYNAYILLMLVLFWFCQIRLPQMCWLLTVVLCVPLSESYVMLKASVLSMTCKQKEFINLQIKIMKHHTKAWLSPEHNSLSVTISREDLCGSPHAHFSRNSAPWETSRLKIKGSSVVQWYARGRKCQQKCYYSFLKFFTFLPIMSLKERPNHRFPKSSAAW